MSIVSNATGTEGEGSEDSDDPGGGSSSSVVYGDWEDHEAVFSDTAQVICSDFVQNSSSSSSSLRDIFYNKETVNKPLDTSVLEEGHYYQVRVVSFSHAGSWTVENTIGSVSGGNVTVEVALSDTESFLFQGAGAPDFLVTSDAYAINAKYETTGGSSTGYFHNIFCTARYAFDVTVQYQIREVFPDAASKASQEINKNVKDIKETTKEMNEAAQETKETTKGIFASIKEFFAGFFDNLIDSVIGLFVPSTEEMGDLFGQLNDFFSDRFGFLYAPFDYMIQLLGVFTSSTGTTGITLPGFSIMGYEVWPDMTYDLSSDPLVGKILEYVRIGTGVLLAGYFIMFLQDFFKERFGSD